MTALAIRHAAKSIKIERQVWAVHVDQTKSLRAVSTHAAAGPTAPPNRWLSDVVEDISN